MKLVDFSAHLVPLLNVTMGEVTELLRALKEGSDHFDAAKLDEATRREAARTGAPVTPELLVSRPGPGGGLPADPFRAAFLVVAIMLGKPRKEIALAVWNTWHHVHKGSVTSGWGENWKPTIVCCSLTGSPLFGEAFKAILASVDLAARVDEVRVSDHFAEIRFDKDKVSRFEDPHRRNYLTREASLNGHAVKLIAGLLSH